VGEVDKSTIEPPPAEFSSRGKKRSGCEQRQQARGKMSWNRLKYRRKKKLWEEKRRFGAQSKIHFIGSRNRKRT